jgi:hypothetical protein
MSLNKRELALTRGWCKPPGDTEFPETLDRAHARRDSVILLAHASDDQSFLGQATLLLGQQIHGEKPE